MLLETILLFIQLRKLENSDKGGLMSVMSGNV